MDWSTGLDVIRTIALIAAVIFAALQVRYASRNRKEQAAVELIRSMQSAEWMSAVGPVSRLPIPGVGHLARDQEAIATTIALRLETVGYLVYRRAVPLDVVDDLVGGITRTAWTRLSPWVMQGRQDSGNQKSYEWFQWLSERLAERGPMPNPAYLAHSDWRP